MGGSNVMRGLVCFVTVLCLIGFEMFTEYNEMGSWGEYAAARDIMIMLVVGFGFLMSFLKLYGLGAVGYTYLLTAMVIIGTILVEGLFERVRKDEWETIKIGVPSLVTGEFAAAAVLISFGALLGKVSLDQMAVVAFFEVWFYAAHKQLLLFGWLEVEDVGGTMSIHLFGAYFGIGAAWLLGAPGDVGANAEGADQKTDVLALIGTTVLFVYWPSFVGAEVTHDEDASMRCVVNTYLALCGSVLATFVLSGAADVPRKLRAVDVQNATLAGGVGIGAIAQLKSVNPVGALAVGLASGAVSTLGYAKVQPALLDAVGLHDTCGVHNLHGMPALFGGFVSAFFVYIAPSDQVFVHKHASPRNRAGIQVLGTVFTFLVALVSGVITGWIAKTFVPTEMDHISFHDSVAWEVGGDFDKDWDAAMDGSKSGHNEGHLKTKEEKGRAGDVRCDLEMAKGGGNAI